MDMNVVAGIALTEETMGWILDLAYDDQDDYLKCGGGKTDYDEEWPEVAKDRAKMCREIADAVRSVGESQRWVELAEAFEESVEEK
jgi:hypothetical protein